jgi:hypothetical protein
MSDKAYEKLIQNIKKINKQEQTTYLGRMISDTVCDINGLRLDNSDLVYAQHLITGYQGVEETIGTLKAGDLVVVLKISSSKFAVIERMVTR